MLMIWKKIDGKQRIEIFNCMMNKKSKLEYKNRFDLKINLDTNCISFVC